jgi:tetratricopeptide (TPR) repeat protein
MAPVKSMAAAALLLFAAAPALAADERDADLQRGNALYDEAVVLLDAKKYAEACPKLEQAIALVPIAVGARLALAECDAGRGRLASALAGYRKAQSLAKAAEQPERERLALTRATELAPRVGTLRLALAAAAEKLAELTVEVDGQRLENASLSGPLPLDAGKHVVQARARGRRAFRAEIDVRDGQAAVIDVTLSEAGTGSPEPEPGSAPAPWRTVGIVAGAAGLVAIGAGAGMGAVAISKNDESYTLGCVRHGMCTPGGAAARNEAYSNAAVATGLFIGGGVLLAAGVGVILAAPRGSKKTTAAAVVLRFQGNGLSVQGAF